MSRPSKPYRKTVVRWEMPDGTRCKAQTPGGRAITSRTDTYYASIGGKSPVSLKTTDLAEAWRRLRKLQRDALERSQGIRDDFTDHAQRPIGEHVEEWLSTLTAAGREDRDVVLIRQRLGKLFVEAKVKRVGDFDKDKILLALGRLQQSSKGRPGISAQTRNHYTAHVRQFSRWLHANERLRTDPLLALRKVRVDDDRRHDRRCPTDAEIGALMLAVDRADAPRRNWMTGPQRCLGYRVCMATGFRAEELKALTRESFDLDKGTVTVRAGYSKRRRKDTQHLPAWLVEELRAWFLQGGKCWDRFPKKFPGRILRLDLAAAGVAWRVETEHGPLFFDFHSFRVWYITFAASLPGISPKTLMEMARHSDPKLTLAVYAKAKDAEVKAAIAQLPRPGAVAPDVAGKIVAVTDLKTLVDTGTQVNTTRYADCVECSESKK